MPKTLDDIKKITQLLREHPGDPIKLSEYTLALEEAYSELHNTHTGLSAKQAELQTKYQEAVELNGKLTLKVSQPVKNKEPEPEPIKWSDIEL